MTMVYKVHLILSDMLVVEDHESYDNPQVLQNAYYYSFAYEDGR